jgi:hypothetical protein
MSNAIQPVAWWIPEAEQFCMNTPEGRPFAKHWEPLYATPLASHPMTAPIGCLDEREAFEAWVLTQPGGTEYTIRRRDIPGSGRLGHYVEPSVDFAWQAICARSASRQEGWQPIADAPKDGTWLLLYGITNRTAAGMLVARWDGRDWESADDGYGAYIAPTHWRPLPVAPHQSQEAQGDRHGE